MRIEARFNGEVLTREEIPEEFLADIQGFSWQQNVEARAQIVAMHLEAFQKKMEKVFQDTIRVEYALVFKSNSNDTH